MPENLSFVSPVLYYSLKRISLMLTKNILAEYATEPIIHASFNTIHATGLFLYLLKTSENQRFPYVFRGYRKRPVTGYGLIINKFSNVCFMYKRLLNEVYLARIYKIS